MSIAYLGRQQQQQRKQSMERFDMCETQTRAEKIADAKQYYTENTFACLSTLKHKHATKEEKLDAKKRLRDNQQWLRAVKYYEKTGCSFKEAKEYIGIT